MGVPRLDFFNCGNGNPTMFITAPFYIDSAATITADTALTVPAKARFAYINVSTDLTYFRLNGTASAAQKVDGTGSAIINAQMSKFISVKPGDTLHFFHGSGTDVSVAFYK